MNMKISLGFFWFVCLCNVSFINGKEKMGQIKLKNKKCCFFFF